MDTSGNQGCLYTICYVPRDQVESLLMRLVRPIAEEIRSHPDLDSLFFVRYSEPRWQLRFRILGRDPWVNGPLRNQVESRVRQLQASGEIEGYELTRYDREYERYGGEAGMGLAEKLFHFDSLACLEIVRLDRAGAITKSRRELAMALVERFLDLATFSPADRLEFYRFGYAWALDQGTWGEEDLSALEVRFQKLRGGLEKLFFGSRGQDPSSFYGGTEVAAVVSTFLEQARPVVTSILEAHAAGRIRQDLRYLFWSYAHMMTNRLGVEAVPEAILRFFMYRLLEERSRSAV
jgi:thiopeptide-type bacteriocin biosynthesis protein